MRIPHIKAYDDGTGCLKTTCMHIRLNKPCCGCRPVRCYDEKTAALMERSVRMLLNPIKAGTVAEHWKRLERLKAAWAKVRKERT